MSQSAGYDDLYRVPDAVDVRSPPSLAYTDIGLGCAGGDAFVTYKVHNISIQTTGETVQVYIEIVYPNGHIRRRMVGWERHQLSPGSHRCVRIGQCGFAFPALTQADDSPASLTVTIRSLSRTRAQAGWQGVFSFIDLKMPPAEGGSRSAGSKWSWEEFV